VKFVQKVGSSWFSVEKYLPQRTRRARRKEDLTAKERKGFSFQISGLTALWTPLPRQEKAQSFNDKYPNLRVLRDLRGKRNQGDSPRLREDTGTENRHG
jgi:hypothetical protein